MTPLDVVIRQAQVAGRTVRRIVDDLGTALTPLRLARHQIAAMIETLSKFDRELAECEQSWEVSGADGGRARALISRVARTHRALHGVPQDSEVRTAAFLARILDVCAHLSAGHQCPDEEPGFVEAMRGVVRTQGVSSTVLAVFANRYPERAAKIDRESLDRLVTAWTIGVEVSGGRWPVIAAVWKKCFRVHLGPDSIKKEMAKLPKIAA